MYVQDTVHDKFVEILVGKAKQLVIGDGFDEKSGGGPVVSPTLLLADARRFRTLGARDWPPWIA